MTVIATWTKQPAERLDYAVDFARWLDDGDTISSATAEATANTVSIEQVQNTSDTVRMVVSGGSDGDKAHIEITATTTAGLIKIACVEIRVKDC